MSPICPNLYTKFWILWDLICIHPLIAVLDVLETQNFAGLLLVTIQTDPTWFGTDPGNFWKMFILVHFAHSESQEPSWGSSLVLVPSIQPYQSYMIILWARQTIYKLKNDVPILSQFCPMYTICIQKSGFINSLRHSRWIRNLERLGTGLEIRFYARFRLPTLRL